MPRSLHFDLRSRVLAAVDEGLSCRQAAERFGVSASSAIRWAALRRAGGNAQPKPQGGDRHSHRTEAHGVLIAAALAEVPDITLTELKERLARQGAITSVTALWRYNRDAFETYVAKVLVPELGPGDVVIMDNLSSHKGPHVRDMIEAAGADLLYLPPYSPDFNPIENAFAKLKALLRKTAARTVSSLWNAIGRLIDTFTPAECANYFAAAGYDAT